MAGPISHVVFAEKAAHSFLNVEDEPQFIVGNLFPDIRYLDVVDRRSSHSEGVTIADIQRESDSFKAGVLLHSLVDETREGRVTKSNVYKLLPNSPLISVALKICEDMKLYDCTPNWQTYINYMDLILTQELDYGVAKSDIRRWHDINIDLFTNPSITEYGRLLAKIGFDKSQINEVLELVGYINAHKVVELYLDDLHSDFRSLLETGA